MHVPPAEASGVGVRTVLAPWRAVGVAGEEGAGRWETPRTRARPRPPYGSVRRGVTEEGRRDLPGLSGRLSLGRAGRQLGTQLGATVLQEWMEPGHVAGARQDGRRRQPP